MESNRYQVGARCTWVRLKILLDVLVLCPRVDQSDAKVASINTIEWDDIFVGELFPEGHVFPQILG